MDDRLLQVEELLLNYASFSDEERTRFDDHFLRFLPAKEAYFARHRYVLGEVNLEKIAAGMKYSKRHVYRYRETVLIRFYLFLHNPDNGCLRKKLRQVLLLKSVKTMSQLRHNGGVASSGKWP